MKRRTRLNREAGTPGQSSANTAKTQTQPSLSEQLYVELQKTRFPNSYATHPEVLLLARQIGAKQAVAYVQMFGLASL